MKKLVAAFALLCAIAGMAQAEEEGRGRWYVSPGVGIMMLDGPTDNEPVFFNLSLGYDLTDHFSVEAGMMYAPVHDAAPGLKGDQSAGPHVDVLFHLLGKDGGRWDPYLTAGLAYWFADGPLFYETYREVLVPRVGVGLAYHLTDDLSLRLEGKTGFPLQTADIDKGWITTAELGMLYRFGGSGKASTGVEPPALALPEDPDYNKQLGGLIQDTTPADAPDWMRYELYVNFDYDQSVIKGEYFAGLNEIARVIKKATAGNPNVTVSVEGHADRRHGSVASYNQRLSETRADKVKAYLVGAGVDGSKTKAVGFGFNKPKVPINLDLGNPENRRVEIYIHGVGDAASRNKLRKAD